MQFKWFFLHCIFQNHAKHLRIHLIFTDCRPTYSTAHYMISCSRIPYSLFSRHSNLLSDFILLYVFNCPRFKPFPSKPEDIQEVCSFYHDQVHHTFPVTDFPQNLSLLPGISCHCFCYLLLLLPTIIHTV